MSSGLLVMGSSNTDLVCTVDHLPAPGETVPSSNYQVVGGGKAANQAVAAARAGASVRFIGGIGDDEFSQQRLADLDRAGVDVSAVHRVEGASSGLAFIFVDRHGENQIVTYGGANDHLTADHVAKVAREIDFDYVLITLESPAACIERAVSMAGELGSGLIVNAAPYDSQIESWVDQIDILIVNEVEAGQLLQKTTVDLETAQQSALAIREAGPGVVLLTLGAAGAVMATVDGTVHIPGHLVDVVDTTGAGDAFCGVLAASLASGLSIQDAAVRAVVAGAVSVTRHGAQPSLPTAEDIELAYACYRH